MTIGGLMKGSKVLCVESDTNLEEGRVYTLAIDCLSTDYFTRLEETGGMIWRVERFTLAPRGLRQGDKLLCIEGTNHLQAGNTYTFRMYFGKDYLVVEEVDMRWRIDRFIVSSKGII